MEQTHLNSELHAEYDQERGTCVSDCAVVISDSDNVSATEPKCSGVSVEPTTSDDDDKLQYQYQEKAEFPVDHTSTVQGVYPTTVDPEMSDPSHLHCRIRGGVPGNIGFDEDSHRPNQEVPGNTAGNPVQEGIHKTVNQAQDDEDAKYDEDEADAALLADSHAYDAGDPDTGPNVKAKSRDQARQRRQIARQVMDSMAKEIDTITTSMSHMHQVLDAARFDTRAVTSARGGGKFVELLSDHRDKYDALLEQAHRLLTHKDDPKKMVDTNSALEAEYRELSRIRLEAAVSGHLLIAMDPTFITPDRRFICWMGDISLACQLYFFLGVHHHGAAPMAGQPDQHPYMQLDEATVQRLKALLTEVRDTELRIGGELNNFLKAQLCIATAQHLALNADRWMRSGAMAHDTHIRSDEPLPQWQQPLLANPVSPSAAHSVDMTGEFVVAIAQHAEDLRMNTMQALARLLPLHHLLHFHCSRGSLFDVIDTIHRHREATPCPPQD